MWPQEALGDTIWKLGFQGLSSDGPQRPVQVAVPATCRPLAPIAVGDRDGSCGQISCPADNQGQGWASLTDRSRADAPKGGSASCRYPALSILPVRAVGLPVGTTLTVRSCGGCCGGPSGIPPIVQSWGTCHGGVVSQGTGTTLRLLMEPCCKPQSSQTPWLLPALPRDPD